LKLKLLVLFILACPAWSLAAPQIASPLSNPQNAFDTYFSGPNGGIGSRDGYGTAARFYQPTGIWADGQYVYVSDAANFTVRKISIATAQVTTIAGSPQQSGYKDGVGSDARFQLLGSLWGDGTNLYVNDGCSIRKVVVATGEVSTFVGNGAGTPCSSSTIDGPANSAVLRYNGPMWGDGAYLYYVDPGVTGIRFSPNIPGAIRVISLATGDTYSIPLPLILTAGGGLSASGIWGQNGYLYTTWFSGYGSLVVARINVATQELGWLFNLLPPAVVGFLPVGLWFDGNDSFYYVEQMTVRRFSLSTGQTTSIATLPSAKFNNPARLTGFGDDLYVSDSSASMISRIHIPSSQVTVFAGLQWNAPQTPADNVTPQSGIILGAWADGQNLYFGRDNTIVRLNLTSNVSSVFATGFAEIHFLWGDGTFLYVTNVSEVDKVSLSTGAVTTLATGLGVPLGIWGDSTYIYVAGNNAVRQVSKATGTVSAFAGVIGQSGLVDGVGPAASFKLPVAMWGDSTYLYVTDSSLIRRVNLSTAEVTTLQTQSPTGGASGIAGDGANLYVGISSVGGLGLTNLGTLKIVISTGAVSVFSNMPGAVLCSDSQFVYIRPDRPDTAIDRIAFTNSQLSRVTPPLPFSQGVVPTDQIPVSATWTDGTFLYGFFGAAIYKVRIADGQITHLAGVFEEPGLVDGIGNHARFGQPNDVWGDGSYLYVVGDARIRRVNIATQQVDTLIGGFLPSYIWGDGQYLYMTDKYHRSIEKTSIAAPQIVQLAGGGQPGVSDFVDGVGTAAHFYNIGPIWGDGANLYVGDGCSIRKFVIATAAVTTIVGIPNVCAHVDGTPDVARLNSVNGIWGIGTLLYVASPHTIRTFDLVTGQVKTIAGDPVQVGTEDGAAFEARFVGPQRVLGDGTSLYVSDTGIRKISFAGSILPFTIQSNGGSYWTAPSSSSSMTTGYAVVSAGAGSANPNGVAVFSYRSNGVLVSEAAVPASAPIQGGRVYVEIGSTVKTGIAIANPNNTSATVTFYFTDAGGTNFGAGSTTIGPNQQINGFLDAAPWNGAAAARSFTFTSSAPVGAIALRGFVNQRSNFLMTTLPIVPVTSFSSAPTVLPYFAAGAGWTTDILLVNPTDNASFGTVQMDAPYNYSVAPRSAVKISTSNAGSQITTGGVRISPALGTPVPVASSVFSLASGGVAVTETGVAAGPAAQSFRLLAEFNSAASMRTGIAIANVGASTASIQLQLLDLMGQPTGFAGSATVAATGNLAAFLDQLPGLQNLPPSFRGILLVTSNLPVTIIGIRIQYNELGDLLMSTTPALADSAFASAGPVLFPHIVAGDGYSTEFILMSPGSSSTGTAAIYSQTGGALSLPVVQ
jgi:hypothetical protein